MNISANYPATYCVDPYRIITTPNGKTYEKPSIAEVGGGIIVGGYVGNIASKNIRKFSRIPVLRALNNMDKKMTAIATNDILPKKIFKNVDSDVLLNAAAREYKQAADKAFKISDLAEKGVKYVGASPANSKIIDEALEKAVPKIFKYMPKSYERIMKKLNTAKQAAIKGKNAFYIPKTKTIFVNKNKASYTAFHEMGHALNHNTIGLGKILTKMRQPGIIFAFAAIAVGLLKRKKVEGEEPTGIIDKITTFIKNNCGKLTFLGFLPTVAEEALASIKGSKLAKGLLSPEAYKTMNKFYAKAGFTYAGAAVGFSAAAFLASKVRDFIASAHEIIIPKNYNSKLV